MLRPSVAMVSVRHNFGVERLNVVGVLEESNDNLGQKVKMPKYHITWMVTTAPHILPDGTT